MTPLLFWASGLVGSGRAQGAPAPARPVDIRNPVAAARPRARLLALDAARGLALLLMILDHALLVLVDPAHPLRSTLTRASLPLFMVVAGHLWRPRLSRRLLEVAAAAAAATAFGIGIGIGQPDVLVVYLAAIAVMGVAHRCGVPPVALLVLGVIQPTAWRLGLTGYEVGTVLALLIIGRVGMLGPMCALFDRAPGWLALIGRYPLTIYVGHLAALWLLDR